MYLAICFKFTNSFIYRVMNGANEYPFPDNNVILYCIVFYSIIVYVISIRCYVGATLVQRCHWCMNHRQNGI